MSENLLFFSEAMIILFGKTMMKFGIFQKLSFRPSFSQPNLNICKYLLVTLITYVVQKMINSFTNKEVIYGQFLKFQFQTFFIQ